MARGARLIATPSYTQCGLGIEHGMKSNQGRIFTVNGIALGKVVDRGILEMVMMATYKRTVMLVKRQMILWCSGTYLVEEYLNL